MESAPGEADCILDISELTINCLLPAARRKTDIPDGLELV